MRFVKGKARELEAQLSEMIHQQRFNLHYQNHQYQWNLYITLKLERER